MSVVLFLLGVFGWTLARAGLESTLWQDEVYSLVVAAQSPGRVLELASRDAHPPGYYLALKAWLKLGRAAGSEPGILWARGLNVAVWALLAMGCWGLGRLLLGGLGGAVLAATVAGGAAAAQWAIDLRGYCLAFTAATLGLLVVACDLSAPALGGRRRALLWTGYGVAATGALWFHLLALPLLGLIFLAWLAFALLDGRSPRWRRLLPGLLAHGVAGLLFLPWLLRVPFQLERLRAAAPDWMTPATWANLANVAIYWYPFSRLGTPDRPPLPGLRLLGLASLGVPVLVLAWARARARGGSPRTASWYLWRLGLVVAGTFALVLWVCDRAGLAPVFFGPRYPLLAAGIWAVGLAGLGLRARDRLGRSLPAWLAVAPWLLCAVLSQVLLGLDEPHRGLAAAAARARIAALAEGGPAFAFPSELAPFFRETLAPLALRPIEELPCAARSLAGATVIDLDPWPDVDRLRDRLVARALEAGLLSASRASQRLAEGEPVVVAHRLAGFHRDALAALCARGWTPAGRAIPPDAAAVALPEDQARDDGWSYLEIDPALAVGRWGSAAASRLAFSGTLPPGRYRLHLVGERTAYPEPRVRMRFSAGGWATTAEVPSGPIDLTLPLELERRQDDLSIVVEHPTWSPAQALGTADSRTLSFFLRAAWLERRD